MKERKKRNRNRIRSSGNCACFNNDLPPSSRVQISRRPPQWSAGTRTRVTPEEWSCFCRVSRLNASLNELEFTPPGVINKHEEGSSPSRNVQPFLLKRKILAISLVFVPTGSTERRIGLRAVSSRDKSREEEAVASVWSVKFHRDRVMRAPIK